MNAPASLAAVRRPLPTALLDALRARLGDRFSTAAAVCEHHGRDESAFPAMPPDAVVFAHTTE
ncbi:MAG: 2-hydroxy-acid oxidase, partial [Burkholderiaceae bacterium]